MKTQGVDSQQWSSTFNSFAIQVKADKASRLATQTYRLEGVPFMIVNGKYAIDPAATGGGAGMLKVASFLINKERAEKAATNKTTNTPAAAKKK
jgi:thiol:disulfide interchange protein DsbA